MSGDNIKHFGDDTFDKDVLGSQVPVLVDFWATWCAPCKAIAPHVESLADQYAGKLLVGKVDIDQNQGVPSKYGIRGVPTLILFKGGKPVEQIVGAVPKSKMEEMIKKHM